MDKQYLIREIAKKVEAAREALYPGFADPGKAWQILANIQRLLEQERTD